MTDTIEPQQRPASAEHRRRLRRPPVRRRHPLDPRPHQREQALPERPPGHASLTTRSRDSSSSLWQYRLDETPTVLVIHTSTVRVVVSLGKDSRCEQLPQLDAPMTDGAG